MNALTSFIGTVWGKVSAGLLVVLALYAGFQAMQARHFKKLYVSEQTAHKLTVANYRAAAAKAQADATANAKRVLTEQQQITQEVSSDYQKQLADVRARADALRVRLASAGNPRGADAGRASQVPAPAGRPDAAPAQDRLPAEGWALEDRVIATEQALQLVALQDWVRKQAEVDSGGD